MRRVMLGRGFACDNCGPVSFIVKGARWPATGPPALEVAWSCASCGTGPTIQLSLEEARRCGSDDPKQGL